MAVSVEFISKFTEKFRSLTSDRTFLKSVPMPGALVMGEPEMPKKQDVKDDSGLTFAEDTHTYRYNNIVVPSVTQIIVSQLGLDMSFIPDRYRDRGLAIHKAIELMILGQLDTSSVQDELIPYIWAYKKFTQNYGFEASDSELMTYNSGADYAGTVDLIGHCNNLVMDNKRPLLIEIKTGRSEKYHKLQTAGYALAVSSDVGIDCDRYALYVHNDTSYDLVQHTNNSDFDNFLALAKAYRVNQLYGGRLK